MHKHKSIYSKLYVPLSRRAKFTPRVGRPHRPKMIAWHGPDAFFKNRFYELDSWYKARIQRPEILPKMHIIDPDVFMESYEQKMIRQKPRTLNIGFSKSKEPVMKKTAEEKANIEKKAISNELIIDLNQVDSSNQLALSEHFNIFEDLFSPGVYFHNTQPLDICWESGEGSSKLMEFVHFGNILKAENTQKRPSVRIGKIGGSSAAFNTLLMVNLEGPGQEEIGTNQSNKSPFNDRMSKVGGKGKAGKPSTDLGVQDAEAEMLERIGRTQLVHWIVANIPDNSNGILESEEEVIPYLQPIPFMGTGYHRFVFLLLRHRKMLDFSAFKNENSQNPDSLLGRAFNVNSFYKAHEEEMTPSAIRFCQIKWDQSCDRAMHEIGLKSPKYWYEWNEPLKPEQKEFPKKSMPFNHYLDLFRNPSTMRQELQKRRLEMLVKMKPEEQILRPQKYPDIFYAENRRKLPEFVHQRRMAENIGEGIFSALYHPYENPAEQHEMEKWRIDGNGVEEKKQMKAT